MDVKLARKKMYILLAEDLKGEGDGQKTLTLFLTEIIT